MKLPEHFKGHHLKRLIMMLALIPSALIYLTACGSQDSSAVNAFSGAPILEPHPNLSPVISDEAVIAAFSHKALILCPYLHCDPKSILTHVKPAHEFSSIGNFAETDRNGMHVFTVDPRLNAELLEPISAEEISHFAVKEQSPPTSWGLPNGAYMRGAGLYFPDMGGFDLKTSNIFEEFSTFALLTQLTKIDPSIGYHNDAYARGGSALIELFKKYNVPLSIQIDTHTSSDLARLTRLMNLEGLPGYYALRDTLYMWNYNIPIKIGNRTFAAPNTIDEAIQTMREIQQALRKN